MDRSFSSNEETVPRALVERILTPDDPFAPEPDKPRLFVGRLPEGLPVAIPVPDGFDVLGGQFFTGGPRGEEVVEVVLDAAMSPDEAREAYRRTASGAGWSEREERWGPPRQGGFSFGPPQRPMLLCRSERGPALHVRLREVSGAPTDVRLNLFAGSHASACSPRSEGPYFESVIPNLDPPPSARQLPDGSGDGGDNAYSTSTLETTLDLPSIRAHYDAQLEAAGWERSDGGASGPQAWSAWTFEDGKGQPWTGLFVALRLPEPPGHHFLQVHARWKPATG